MAISIFQLFSIGIGPSSSHTVGPMRAARRFVSELNEKGFLQGISTIKVELYGSLALTGKGHQTHVAVILGLVGEHPEHTDPSLIQKRIDDIREQKSLNVFGIKQIVFNEDEHLIFHKDKQLPYHPNGMRFTAYNETGNEIFSKVSYSVGGGFIVDHETVSQDRPLGDESHEVPYPFKSAEVLLQFSRDHNMTIAEVILENEKTWREEKEIADGLLNIWKVMKECIERGCHQEGILAGGLNVKRRAPSISQRLKQQDNFLEWVSLWALAVGEENGAGGRVVTAPTNGSAGLIPAVLKYYENFTSDPTDKGIITFLLTAGAIGILYKEGASISAAEMGCMGEVGVACSMAAAGLTAALGGTPEQIENAAEIGMEHNLGLTCDPVKGLVQIPCIERNTMGAVKAINASLLALQGDGGHHVSLDQVIATMRQTGNDMQSIYKETSLGGLAVNVPEC